MTNPRGDGYYWIKLRSSGDKLIAEWFDGKWWRPGDDADVFVGDVIVISKRIEEPSRNLAD